MEHPTPVHGFAHASLRTYRAPMETHLHSHRQLLIGVQGCLTVRVARRTYSVGPGQGLIVPAGREHGFWAHGDTCRVVLDCAASGVIAPMGPVALTRAQQVAPQRLPSADSVQIRPFARQLLDTPRCRQTPGADLRAARLTEARRRLASGAGIGTTAAALGYGSASAFSQAARPYLNAAEVRSDAWAKGRHRCR